MTVHPPQTGMEKTIFIPTNILALNAGNRGNLEEWCRVFSFFYSPGKTIFISLLPRGRRLDEGEKWWFLEWGEAHFPAQAGIQAR